MRVSPKKRAANRRNALKSTGPKTASGRRTSARNATRHGLSVPLPTHLVEPVQQQLVQLIMSDGFEYEVANNLAEKIIEYERNVLYLLELYYDIKMTGTSQRYFKRASNQLIKALRQL